MEKNYRDGFLLRSSNHHRSETRSTSTTTSSDFVLQWGNRKRLRCMKVHNKNSGSARAEHDDLSEPSGSAPVQRTTGRADRRVGRSDPNRDSSNHQQQHGNNTGVSNGYLNLRQRPASPSHRILRNSENSVAMRERSNGLRNLASPDKGDKRGGAHNNNHTRGIHNNDNNQHHHHGGGGGSVSSETGHESKKGGSSSGSDAIPVVWPPKFVIALTNKEKEEDFMAIKGSKLPQRPKKRAKFIQRTLNLISPGAWLCDLSLERYEVREKKVSKKRPRGLKAMGNMDSDSE
ncbi:uncharacterized protein LOC116022552 isoform X1 [Ipomoea triloba]|uniref:uncharacterized protein LOC116022552 isoform X1 n=1 Tax=Ipomoea triloba TaxID=35885 RepID=UPI00125DCE83|nr:uncharacterized protein LOC116022552 isoform X1 [Ipomoea triloba]